jgi:hypothetical protein
MATRMGAVVVLEKKSDKSLERGGEANNYLSREKRSHWSLSLRMVSSRGSVPFSTMPVDMPEPGRLYCDLELVLPEDIP